MRLHLVVVTSLLIGSALQPVLAQAPANSSLATAPAVLAPGDQIRIAVWERADLSGDFVIAIDGTIVHPLYRRINAAGIPMAQLENRIRVFLEGFQVHPEFVVSPLFRVFVGGEVRSPGTLSIPPGTTLAQTIALSGGINDDGRLDQVRLVRNLVPTELDLSGADTAALRIQVHSSDEIVVGRRHRFFRDVLLPVASVVGALGAIASVVILTTGRR